MKIQLLVAVGDSDYAEHLSSYLMEKYSDLFEVATCRNAAGMMVASPSKGYDAALLSEDLVDAAEQLTIRLRLLLWEGDGRDGIPENIRRVKKYQRISSLVSEILEEYSHVRGRGGLADKGNGRVLAVWSPSGGSGNTTVAMSIAACLAASGKKTLYLDLEPFSSADVYFEPAGKGLSAVLEKLDKDVDIGMLLASICREDSGSGIHYYCKPDNYDDMNVLTVDDVEMLLTSCLANMEEIVVDLPGNCDDRVRYVMESADRIFTVVDGSLTCEAKWKQFVTQNDLYSMISDRLVLVGNKGAKPEGCEEALDVIKLPKVKSNNPTAVYKTLSIGYFDSVKEPEAERK